MLMLGSSAVWKPQFWVVSIEDALGKHMLSLSAPCALAVGVAACLPGPLHATLGFSAECITAAARREHKKGSE